MRKTTSTAAALRFRRTSCRRRWSSGYKSREFRRRKMDLSLSDEQKQLKDAARRFVRDKYVREPAQDCGH
jgi:hypothetical protein